jgi:hypothetical protein
MDFAQRALVAGLTLGNCRIHASGQTPAVDVRTQQLGFAVWLYENLGWMANTIHRSAPGTGQRRPTYIVRTVPHPTLDHYRQWQIGDDYPSAARTLMSTFTVRTWVAKKAGVGWSGKAQSRKTRFHAEDDTRRRWYGAVLSHLGYSPYDSGLRLELNQSDSEDLFDRIGPPVPGVEHKWLFDKQQYEEKRHEQWADREVTRTAPLSEGVLGRDPRTDKRIQTERETILYLREAAVDGDLTAAQYNDWRSHPDHATPVGMGAMQKQARWSVWKTLAGLN